MKPSNQLFGYATSRAAVRRFWCLTEGRRPPNVLEPGIDATKGGHTNFKRPMKWRTKAAFDGSVAC